MSKKNINNITHCEIDGTDFSSMSKFLYHLKKLNTTQKEYYDKYLRNGVIPSCPVCKKEPIFVSIGVGYTKYCSLKCAGEHKKSPEMSKQVGDKIKSTKLKKYGSENYVNREKYKSTCLERYGVESATQLSSVKEKNKATCLQRYGETSYAKTAECNEKRKETCLEKYGVEYHTQSDVVKEKSRATCMDKYGVEYTLQVKEIRDRIEKTVDEKYGGFTFESKELSEKVKNTMIERYGVESPLQNAEILKKVQDTNTERYGGITANKNPEIVKKTKETNLKRYGVENTFNTIQVKNTFLEKYGVVNASQIPGVQDKVKATNLERYGKEAFFATDRCKEKSKETCLEKYGVEHAVLAPNICKRGRFKIKKYITKWGTDIRYQSKSELEFIKFCETNGIFVKNGPIIPYHFNFRDNKYYVDLMIIDENKNTRLIEIKRKHPWWFKDLISGKIKAKANAAIKYSKEMGYLPYKILFETKIAK